MVSRIGKVKDGRCGATPLRIHSNSYAAFSCIAVAIFAGYSALVLPARAQTDGVAIFATNSARLGAGVAVSGDVIVVGSRGSEAVAATLRIGRSARVDGRVLADSIELESDAAAGQLWVPWRCRCWGFSQSSGQAAVSSARGGPSRGLPAPMGAGCRAACRPGMNANRM